MEFQGIPLERESKCRIDSDPASSSAGSRGINWIDQKCRTWLENRRRLDQRRVGTPAKKHGHTSRRRGRWKDLYPSVRLYPLRYIRIHRPLEEDWQALLLTDDSTRCIMRLAASVWSSAVVNWTNEPWKTQRRCSNVTNCGLSKCHGSYQHSSLSMEYGTVGYRCLTNGTVTKEGYVSVVSKVPTFCQLRFFSSFTGFFLAGRIRVDGLDG